MESYGGYRQINGTKKQNQIHKNIWYMIIEQFKLVRKGLTRKPAS